MQTQDDIDMVDDVPPAGWEASHPPSGDADADLADWLDPLADDGSPPIYYATDEVKIIGTPPLFIIWRGRQWCVTSLGIERRDGTCRVKGSMLWNAGTIRKVIAVEGIDMDDFQEALRLARRMYHGD